jgi:hypothetical protein
MAATDVALVDRLVRRVGDELTARQSAEAMPGGRG